MWYISFGEPTLYNVIGYHAETDQYHIQVPGHFGSRYRKREKAMSPTDVQCWLLENAAMEADRLSKLKIELRSMLLTDTKIKVTHQMMVEQNMSRGDQYGVPLDPQDPSKGLRWMNLMDMEDEDYDKIEAYFLRKQEGR